MSTAGITFSKRIQKFITNSKRGIKFAEALGRFVPPQIGYPLARFLGDYIARQRHWEMVRAARLNQWVVGDRSYSSEELDNAVRHALRFQAQAIYETYRYLARPEKMAERIFLPPEMMELLKKSHHYVPGQGIILVGSHLSNFDLVLHMLLRFGWQGLGITVATLEGGYQEQARLRQDAGMELVPASVNSFRLAIERLKAGGMVLTGIDRPIDHPKHWPKFFGHPAPLPVHHVYLALKACVPIIFLAPQVDSNGIYHLNVSEPIYMEPGTGRENEIIRNAERVLLVAEQYIRQAPHQWAMYYPVWPDLFETVPR